MYRNLLRKLIIGIGVIGSLHTAVSGGQESNAIKPQTPIVLGTTLDYRVSELTISGTDFGINQPSVRLGGRSLQVTSHAPNRIVVSVPPSVPSATYSLVVTSADIYGSSSKPFYTTIGSVESPMPQASLKTTH